MFPPDAHCLSTGRACAWSSRQLSIFSLSHPGCSGFIPNLPVPHMHLMLSSELSVSITSTSLTSGTQWVKPNKGCFLSFTGKRCSTWGSLCPTMPPEPIPLRDSIWGTAGMAVLCVFISWQKKPSGLIELSVDVHHWARQQRPALEATDCQWSSEWSMNREMDQHLWTDYRFWCGAMARFSASKNPYKMCGQNLLHTYHNQF